ncbi:MAG: hypothetical protein L0Z49_10620, partial [Actinobacteria bacterium]|nr:hypothetical protein [Actinomycetota bacterium]
MRARFTIGVIVAVVAGLSATAVAQGENNAQSAIDLIYHSTAMTPVHLQPDGSVTQGQNFEEELAVTPDGKVVSTTRTTRLPDEPPEVKAAAEEHGMTGCAEESKNPGFMAHRPPASIVERHRNEFGLYQGFMYSVDKARPSDRGGPTFQVLMCGVGGIDAEHGSRITVSGPGVYFEDKATPFIINKKWPEMKTPKSSSTELGFEVGPRDGPAKVKASISQNPTQDLKGSILPPYNSDIGEYFVYAAHGWCEDGCLPKCLWRSQG